MLAFCVVVIAWTLIWPEMFRRKALLDLRKVSARAWAIRRGPAAMRSPFQKKNLKRGMPTRLGRSETEGQELGGLWRSLTLEDCSTLRLATPARSGFQR